jgi:hypothetical protein
MEYPIARKARKYQGFQRITLSNGGGWKSSGAGRIFSANWYFGRQNYRILDSFFRRSRAGEGSDFRS